MTDQALVRRLPENSLGRDFVVGDLHGCFDLLERLLDRVSFDPGCDRLFSVGDMIDRGTDSLRCLQLLAEPWFYAVQGNHELMMLNFFLPYLVSGRQESLEDDGESDFLMFGGAWVKQYYQSDRQCMSEDFNRCLLRLLDVPLVWVVGETRKSRFHVVHAELVRPDYPVSGHIVWQDSDIDRWLGGEKIDTDAQEHIYWGRTLMLGGTSGRNAPRMQRGLSTTFCGHTYSRSPRQIRSHLCVDTGAFASMNKHSPTSREFGLTLFDVRQSRWYRASYGRTKVIRGLCFSPS